MRIKNETNKGSSVTHFWSKHDDNIVAIFNLRVVEQ